MQQPHLCPNKLCYVPHFPTSPSWQNLRFVTMHAEPKLLNTAFALFGPARRICDRCIERVEKKVGLGARSQCTKANHLTQSSGLPASSLNLAADGELESVRPGTWIRPCSKENESLGKKEERAANGRRDFHHRPAQHGERQALAGGGQPTKLILVESRATGSARTDDN